MSENQITRRQFLKSMALSTIATSSISVPVLAYAAKVAPKQVTIEHVSLKMPLLDPAFHGYKLVQISDFHMDYTWMSENRLTMLMHLVNDQKPDAVAITGDFVTWQADPFEDSLVRAMQMVNPRDSTVAVLGNHDYWTNDEAVRRAIRRGGITDIKNKFHTVRRGTSMLHLCGVDDIVEKRHRLNLVLEALPDAGAAILLAHEPDYADVSSRTKRFDVQLSGHSHGGQVKIPLIGPIFLPQMAHQYPEGQYTVNGMLQYTNRGLGLAYPQFRINCPPEITVFTLESPPEH